MRALTTPQRLTLDTADPMASERSPHDRAFVEIFDEHRDHLHRVALRLEGDAESAKDLIQETLLRAWAHFAEFTPGTHAGAWLATIMTRLFLDRLKHARVERRAEPELSIPEAVEWIPTIFGVTDADLYAAVRALDPPLREAVDLCYLQQMRRREAAAALNVPEGTIGTRLMRARERLFEALGHSLDHPLGHSLGRSIRHPIGHPIRARRKP
jgi:RNA polymerase sigma-70 factor (ECF subfamily)